MDEYLKTDKAKEMIKRAADSLGLDLNTKKEPAQDKDPGIKIKVL